MAISEFCRIVAWAWHDWVLNPAANWSCSYLEAQGRIQPQSCSSGCRTEATNSLLVHSQGLIQLPKTTYILATRRGPSIFKVRNTASLLCGVLSHTCLNLLERAQPSLGAYLMGPDYQGQSPYHSQLLWDFNYICKST